MINVEELWQEPAHSEALGSRQDQPSKRLRWHEVQETEDVGDPPMAGQLRHFDPTMLGLVFLLGTSLRFSKYIDRSFNTNIYIYINIMIICIHTSSIVYCTFRSGTECVGFIQYLRFRPHSFKRKKTANTPWPWKVDCFSSVTWQTLSARVTELHTFWFLIYNWNSRLH